MTYPHSDLTRFDDEYRAADAKSDGEFQEPPNGTYQCAITSAKVGTIQNGRNAGSPMFSIEFAAKGWGKIWKHSRITNTTIPFIKGDLAVLRLNLERFSDLSYRAKELEGLQCEVDVSRSPGRNGGEFVNKSIRRLITSSGNGGQPQPQTRKPVTEAVQSEYEGYTNGSYEENNDIPF